MKAYLLNHGRGPLKMLRVVDDHDAWTPSQVRDSPREHGRAVQVKKLLGRPLSNS